MAIPTIGAFLNAMRLYLANDRKITSGFILLFLTGTSLTTGNNHRIFPTQLG